MALFELPIYGKNDEVIKTYATDHVRWGVIAQAAELQSAIEGKPTNEKFKAISEFVKKIFPELTDADIENADFDDVMNTFNQLARKTDNINGATPKNADGGA